VCQQVKEEVPNRDRAGAARLGEESPVAFAHGPGVVAKLWGATLHPCPMEKQLDKGPGPPSWAKTHLACPQGVKEAPNQGCDVASALLVKHSFSLQQLL